MTRTETIKKIMAAFCIVFVTAMISLAPIHAEAHTPRVHQGNVQNTASGIIPCKESAPAASRTDYKTDDDIIIEMGIVFILAICVLNIVSSVLRGDDIMFGPIFFLLLVAGSAMLALSR